MQEILSAVKSYKKVNKELTNKVSTLEKSLSELREDLDTKKRVKVAPTPKVRVSSQMVTTTLLVLVQ